MTAKLNNLMIYGDLLIFCEIWLLDFLKFLSIWMSKLIIQKHDRPFNSEKITISTSTE